MSERRGAVLATAALLLLFPSRAMAQPRDTSLQQLRARFEAVSREFRALDSVVRHHRVVDSIGRARRDTVQVEGVLIVHDTASAASIPAVRDALLGVQRELPGVLQSLRGLTITLGRSRFSSDGRVRVQITGADGSGWSSEHLPRDARTLTRFVDRRIRLHAGSAVGDPLHSWAPDMFNGRGTDGERFAQVRVELASADNALARQCLGGNVAACRLVTGLDVPEGPIRRALYTEAEMVRAVQRLIPQWSSSVASPLHARCLRGEAIACDSAMTERAADLFSPLSLFSGLTVLDHAMDLGGDSAYHRLMASGGTRAARLAAAAGVTEDSLMRSWHARIRSARVADRQSDGAGFVATAVWVVLIGGLATRSSRWR